MIIEETEEFREMRANWTKFLDSTSIYHAFKGYADNQYNKMNLFTPDERTKKFCVAYIRSLQQGIELLSTGDFSPRIVRNHDFLMDVKTGWSPDKHV
jgi:hypothetical protein